MDPFLGEIRVFSFGYAPSGWAFCNGQTLPIQQFTALYSLLGLAFGGDGRSNFGLPNLQGNVAIGMGQGPGLSQYNIGATGGTSSVTLSSSQLAAHVHSLNASQAQATLSTAKGDVLALSSSGGRGGGGTIGKIYSGNPAQTALDTRSIGPNSNGVQGHNNMQPYLQMNYCIALQGIYPRRP